MQRKILTIITLFTMVFFATSCDETQVRNLGAKVGLRGQDVGESAVFALEKVLSYEKTDFSQRQRLDIAVQPAGLFSRPASEINTVIQTKHFYFDREQMANRFELYTQLAKAYSALQKLSDGNFGKDSSEAFTAFNTSLTKIKAVPQLPTSASGFLAGLTGFIVDKKQASDIRIVNSNLYSLVRAHRELWEADRKVWTAYFNRAKSSYVNNLRSLPESSFDADRIKKEANQPFKEVYLIQLYKNLEENRVEREIAQLEEYLDRVDQAFRQLEKGHIELAKQTPSYLDAIAELDGIVTLVEPLIKKN